MILAFCLYKYFPFGGLQRDFLRIAQACQSRRHQIRVYVMSWEGDKPDDMEIVFVPTSSKTNHGKNTEYYHWVSEHMQKNPADVVIGFNKMPGLDVYYAADVCYAEKVTKEKGCLYKLTARYKHYRDFEHTVFKNRATTKLLMLTQHQIEHFKKHYQTQEKRFYRLPPGIALDRKYDRQIENARQIHRKNLGVSVDQFFLLQVGSDFKRKGVDRTLYAIAALPNAIKEKTLLMVVGQDKATRYQRLAKKLGIEQQVYFYAGRDDIAELMSAADLLMHPAYHEAAGIVLLEAISAGLPVIASEVCGYAHFISEGQCGAVIPFPFEQKKLNLMLSNALYSSQQRQYWADNARHFADTTDLYSLPEKAADIILGEVK